MKTRIILLALAAFAVRDGHIATSGLAARPGVAALDGFTLRVGQGERVALVGPSGAGKTSLVEAVAGVRRLTSGRVEVFGHDVHTLREASRARQIAFVPQQPVVPTGMSVAEYVGLGRTPHRGVMRIGRDDDQQIVREVLSRVGIESFARRDVGSLSGGERQRVVLARALAQHTLVLVLDEPTTGLDPQARHLIWERMKTLLGEGRTIVLTTHFMDEAERLCHRLVVIAHGRKIAEGTPRGLIAEHLEPDVVEVYGGDTTALSNGPLRALASRVEVSGETVFFYTRDARPLLQALQQQSHLRVLHRPANLEDLFLKLTGRQIRTEG